MSTEETDQTTSKDQETSETPESGNDGDDKTETSESSNDGDGKLELSDEGKEQVEQMQQAYEDDRPTAVLPGTDNTITGVAVNEWLDDDGNPKFGKDEQKQKDEQQDKDEHEDGDKHEDADKHKDGDEKHADVN